MKKAVDSQVNCDRTFRAKVTEVVQTDKIRVLHNGKTYTVYSSIFCEVDDMIRVCVPCGNWQELYVIENRSKGKTLRDLYQNVGELSKSIIANESRISANQKGINLVSSRVSRLEGPKEVFVGSIVLWPNTISVSDNERHNIITSSEDSMIQELFRNIPIPSGWKKCWRISATITTNNGGNINIGFNGKSLIARQTWSKSTFVRPVLSNKFYDWTEFPTELADGYKYNGLNLYYKLDQPSASGAIYGITLNGYFERI